MGKVDQITFNENPHDKIQYPKTPTAEFKKNVETYKEEAKKFKEQVEAGMQKDTEEIITSKPGLKKSKNTKQQTQRNAPPKRTPKQAVTPKRYKKNGPTLQQVKQKIAKSKSSTKEQRKIRKSVEKIEKFTGTEILDEITNNERIQEKVQEKYPDINLDKNQSFTVESTDTLKQILFEVTMEIEIEDSEGDREALDTLEELLGKEVVHTVMTKWKLKKQRNRLIEKNSELPLSSQNYLTSKANKQLKKIKKQHLITSIDNGNLPNSAASNIGKIQYLQGQQKHLYIHLIPDTYLSEKNEPKRDDIVKDIRNNKITETEQINIDRLTDLSSTLRREQMGTQTSAASFDKQLSTIIDVSKTDQETREITSVESDQQQNITYTIKNGEEKTENTTYTTLQTNINGQIELIPFESQFSDTETTPKPVTEENKNALITIDKIKQEISLGIFGNKSGRDSLQNPRKIKELKKHATFFKNINLLLSSLQPSQVERILGIIRSPEFKIFSRKSSFLGNKPNIVYILEKTAILDLGSEKKQQQMKEEDMYNNSNLLLQNLIAVQKRLTSGSKREFNQEKSSLAKIIGVTENDVVYNNGKHYIKQGSR